MTGQDGKYWRLEFPTKLNLNFGDGNLTLHYSVHPLSRMKLRQTDRKARSLVGNEPFQNRIAPSVTLAFQGFVDTRRIRPLLLDQAYYDWLEAVQFASTLRFLPAGVAGQLDPFRDCLLMQIKPSSDLSRLSMFIAKLVLYLEERGVADHIQGEHARAGE